ncbi:hypothetical protein J8L70_12640 [Pseudoalteromonas sp. MMG010]|uniref:hypothetical protein n=1 Tax=Pseudoalteromonas sp. MMG010 TaxID=2822685 RepID=UPI001B39DDBE|nr:hypothetical protein [Pseudoalteromonas sp. MMG010]MBQ4834093.1 hypothetical protein [Pseudoalteromonas sp. MMG010]
MRFILFTLLFLCHWNAFAINYFVKDESCEPTSDTIQIKMSSKLSNLNEKTAEKKRLRSKAIEEYSAKGVHAENVQVVEQFQLEVLSRKMNSAMSKVTRNLDYVVRFTPSTHCNQQKAITEDMFIAGTHKQGKTLLIKGKTVEFTVNTSNTPKFTEFKNTSVTPSSFVGQTLGQSIERTLSSLGLASLEFGNGNKKILVYGRNHALHFIDNKLVGYQFHINLLPMLLNNELSLENKELEIRLDAQDPIYLNTPLTAQHITQLKKHFTHIDTAIYKESINETNHHLAGISQGTLIENIDSNSKCYGGVGSVNDFMNKHQDHLPLKLLNENLKSIIITRCNELLYERAGYISKIKLIEPFSTKNIKLVALANYFNKSSAWQFASAKYESPTDTLSAIGEYDEFLDKAEFSSELWDGYFYTYDGLLISAELTNNN